MPLRQNTDMTEETELILEIQRLPKALRAEALEMIRDLVRRKAPRALEKRPRRKAGSHPGLFVMAPDFDDPLEDFEEYM